MAVTFTITSAEAGDNIKLTLESLSNSAFTSLPSLAEDYVGDGCLRQQVINMPVRLFVAFKVVA